MRKSGARTRFLITCVAPATILFFIFMIYPTIQVFYLSLFNRGSVVTDKNPMVFAGLNNFKILFGDKRFIAAMQNTILLIVTVTILTFFLSIVFAAILTREKIKGQNFFRIVFYIPNILSVVVISGIFSAIYDVDRGLLNSLIAVFRNGDPIKWKAEPMVIWSVIIAMVWQAIGYYMVMYMSSMSAVSVSLYESASLDGAGKLKQFFTITLPLIWTNIRTTLSFFIISTINMAFMFINAMLARGAKDTALNFMFNQQYDNLYGYAMAAGVVIFIFSFALSGMVNLVTKRDVLQY